MAVPIIGELKIGEDWFLTIPIECPCGQRFLLLGQVGALRPCPGCCKGYKLMRMPTQHPVTGTLGWPIGVALPEVP